MTTESDQHFRFHPTPNPDRDIWQCIIACALIALAIRGAIVFSGPWVEGDAQVYANVARNLLNNGCISMDHWAAATCSPHWGGNQLPGYPAFIAVAWLPFGENDYAPLLLQSIMFSISQCYLCWILRAYGISIIVVWCIGLALAVSPSLAGWSRVLTTESLSATVALWILAELIRSLADAKLRVVPIGVACLTGFFLRYDFALLALPIGFCAIALHGTWGAIKRGLIILAVVAIPFGAWTARSINQGLPATPPFGLTSQGLELPAGVLAWIATWLTHQYQLGTSVWPLATQSYGKISPPEAAYANDDERSRVQGLLSQLRMIQSGDTVSAEIDAGFAEIARVRRERDPFYHYGLLPLRRLGFMWANPAVSMGWPGMLDHAKRADLLRIMAQSGKLRGSLEVLAKYPLAVLTKGTATIWRLSSVLLALLVFALSFRKAYRPYRMIIWLCLLFVATRSAVFSQTLLVETRYLTMALPWSDVAGGIGVGWLLMRLGIGSHRTGAVR